MSFLRDGLLNWVLVISGGGRTGKERPSSRCHGECAPVGRGNPRTGKCDRQVIVDGRVAPLLAMTEGVREGYCCYAHHAMTECLGYFPNTH